MGHFHLLLGVIVVQEHITMWNTIAVDLVRIHHLRILAIALTLELIYSRFPSTGNALIGAYDHTFRAKSLVKGVEGHDELDRRTVRVRDDHIALFEDISIDFWYDQFLVGVHAPST